MALIDDVVEYYKLDNSLSAEVDGAHDLTNNNAVTFDAGDKKEGTHSAEFANGSSQSLSLSDDPHFDVGVGVSYTIAFWFKWALDRDSALSAKYVTGNGWFNYVNYVTTDRFFVHGHADNYAQENFTANDAALTPGAWYHVVVSFNATADTMDIWISSDGGTFADVVDMNWTSITTDSDVNAADFNIGLDQRGESGYADGHVDIWAMWKQAVDATEAESIYDGSWLAAGGLSIPIVIHHRRHG